jgi:hypothetical protein
MNKRVIALRGLIVLGCVVAFVLLVLWRQDVVRMQRGKTIVSTISEWQRHGKPVVVKEIAHEDMKVYTKISITPLSKTLFEGYVTKDIQERLRPGQEIFIETEKGRRFGVIKDVNRAMDVDSGMFRIRAAFNPVVNLRHHIAVGDVHVDTKRNVVSVPHEIIENENGKFFIWKIEDGHAARQNVILGFRNGYRAVILKGLHDGDMVVVEGHTQLYEKDKVKILGNEMAKGDER